MDAQLQDAVEGGNDFLTVAPLCTHAESGIAAAGQAAVGKGVFQQRQDVDAGGLLLYLVEKRLAVGYGKAALAGAAVQMGAAAEYQIFPVCL